MRRYEQIYILRPSLSEEEITRVIENASQVITDDGGSIISLDKWGMRKLAYLIKKEPQGYYVFSDIAATPGAIAEIERKFRIDDAVLKYLTVKISEDISAEEITEAQNAASKAAAHEAENEAGDDSPDPEQAKSSETDKAQPPEAEKVNPSEADTVKTPEKEEGTAAAAEKAVE